MSNWFGTKKALAAGTEFVAIVQELDAGYDQAFLDGRASRVSTGLRTQSS